MDILPAAGSKARSTFNTTGSSGETRQSVSPSSASRRDPSAPISANIYDQLLTTTPPSPAAVTTTTKLASDAVVVSTGPVDPKPEVKAEVIVSATYKADRSIASLDTQLEIHGAAPLKDGLRGPALQASKAKGEFFSRMESILSQPVVDPRQTLDQVILAMKDLNVALSDAAGNAAAGEVSAVAIPGSAFNARDARLQIMQAKIEDKKRDESAAKKEKNAASLSYKAMSLELARKEAEIEALEAESKKRPAADRQPLIEKAAELRALLPEVRGKVTAAKDRLSGADSLQSQLSSDLDKLENQLMNETTAYIGPSSLAPPIPDMIGLPPLGAPILTQPTPPPTEKTFMQKALPFAALAGIAALGYSAISKGGKSDAQKAPKKRGPVTIDSLED